MKTMISVGIPPRRRNTTQRRHLPRRMGRRRFGPPAQSRAEVNCFIFFDPKILYIRFSDENDDIRLGPMGRSPPPSATRFPPGPGSGTGPVAERDPPRPRPPTAATAATGSAADRETPVVGFPPSPRQGTGPATGVEFERQSKLFFYTEISVEK